jgi:hypothetical protein
VFAPSARVNGVEPLLSVALLPALLAWTDAMTTSPEEMVNPCVTLALVPVLLSLLAVAIRDIAMISRSPPHFVFFQMGRG